MTTTRNNNHSTSSGALVDEKGGGSIHSQSPVFILGLMQRCGSNFLSEILLIHSEFQLPSVLDEDYLLEHSHLLVEYVDKTYRRWKGLPWIKTPEVYRSAVLTQIGKGIMSVLADQIEPGRRLLTKTPAAYNVDKFFHLFPDAKLLVLIRDGRDAVESAAKKWPTEPYELWMEQWAEGARGVLDFAQGAGAESRGKSWQMVRYEDLLASPEATVAEVLRFLDLDPGNFDWQRMQHLPLFGSSQYPDQSGDVARVLEKPKDFNPIQRWRDWGWSRKRSFKKLAGNELVGLGYVANNNW